MNLAGFSIRRPVTVCMGILVLLALGGVSLSRLPIDLLPEMNMPIAVAMASYSGAGPEEIEKLVTRPLESVLTTVSNVKNVRSISSPGSSLVIVEFNWGTDMDLAALDMREKIDLVSAALPSGVKRPSVYRFDPSMVPVMSIGISAEGRDMAAQKSLLEDRVINRLERLDGVAYAVLTGGPIREIKVSVDQACLSGYGVTLNQLVQLLQSENLNLPGGIIEEGGLEYVVRTTGEFKSIDEIRNLSLVTPAGTVIRLCDVATVDEVEDQSGAYSLLNGQQSLSITIQKETGANTVQVASRVRNEMAQIAQSIPNLNYDYIFDQSEFIELSIANLKSSALLGALLAVFVLYVFLRNFRSTLIISLSIPISIIITFTLVYFNKLTLNMMSLGGLALGVGMLVDNSIVVLESIYRYSELGEDRVSAAQLGTSEVGMAITASTLTTIAVFVPIVYIQGLVAEIFRQLALTVTFSLLSSLLVALTLVPLLSSRLLKVEDKVSAHPTNNKLGTLPRRLADRIGQALSKLNHSYCYLLTWSLDHRRLVLTVAVGAFVLSLVAIPFCGREFIPKTDSGQVSINIKLPLGSTIEETGEVAQRVEQVLTDIPEVDTIFTSVGGSDLMAAGGMGTNAEQATIEVGLVSKRERKQSDVQVAERVRQLVQDVAGAEIAVSAQDMVGMHGGGNSPISIQIHGDDIEVLHSLADDIAATVKDVPGTREVETSFEEGRPEIQVQLNRSKAASLGLSAGQVAQAVDMAVNGQVATRYRVGGDEVDIIVQLTEEQRQNLTDIRGMVITSPLGIQVTLGDVAELVLTEGPSSIYRENQSRVATVSADVVGRSLGTVSNDISRELQEMQLPEGYSVQFGGENKEMMEAFADLSLVLVFAVVLVYMVMAAQFESLLHPLVIMFSMPLGLIGVVFGLAITGKPISILVAIGIIVLSGVVVNNAIVLVDYINTLRRRGLSIREAILEAGPTRLRPILMTTLTTVLGLVPMALGLGEGGELEAPLAVTIIFGLSMSTILTLVVVPLVYTLFEDIGAVLTRRLPWLKMGRAKEEGVVNNG
ncbi:MAG: efflux RND transporter permease subunit [bacterium]|jgi:HAE1 family hydrophobic/amphiphilic exporter-1